MCLHFNLLLFKYSYSWQRHTNICFMFGGALLSQVSADDLGAFLHTLTRVCVLAISSGLLCLLHSGPSHPTGTLNENEVGKRPWLNEFSCHFMTCLYLGDEFWPFSFDQFGYFQFNLIFILLWCDPYRSPGRLAADVCASLQRVFCQLIQSDSFRLTQCSRGPTGPGDLFAPPTLCAWKRSSSTSHPHVI